MEKISNRLSNLSLNECDNKELLQYLIDLLKLYKSLNIKKIYVNLIKLKKIKITNKIKRKIKKLLHENKNFKKISRRQFAISN